MGAASGQDTIPAGPRIRIPRLRAGTGARIALIPQCFNGLGIQRVTLGLPDHFLIPFSSPYVYKVLVISELEPEVVRVLSVSSIVLPLAAVRPRRWLRSAYRYGHTKISASS